MGRPPLPLGTWGSISTREVAPGTYMARTRYRDFDGVTRLVERRGSSKAAATRALREALATRPTPVGAGLSADSRVKLLADQFFADARTAGKPSERSLRQYEGTWRRRLAPAIGELRISEATTGLLNSVIGSIQRTHPQSAVQAYSLLRQIMGVAVRMDILTVNPADGVKTPGVPLKQVRALTNDELTRLRRNIAAWQSEAGRPDYLLDLVDVMLGTGIRISDLCALRWENVDLDSRTILLDSHVVRADGGWEVVPGSKSRSSHRRLTIPPFTANALRDRRGRVTGNWVFPDHAGTTHAKPASVTKHWRRARGEEFDWAGTHVLRKTVANLIAQVVDLEAAANQLGHSSSNVTRRHYVEVVNSVDMSTLLSKLSETDEFPMSSAGEEAV